MEFLADLLSLLSLGKLFEDPGPVENSLYVNLLFVLAAATLQGALLTVRPRLFSGGNTLHERIMQRYGSWLAWIAGAGIAVIALRYSNAPFFSKRVWTAADVGALVLLAVHFIRYRLSQYPADAAWHDEELRRRRFRTGPPSPNRRRRRR